MHAKAVFASTEKADRCGGSRLHIDFPKMLPGFRRACLSLFRPTQWRIRFLFLLLQQIALNYEERADIQPATYHQYPR